MTGLDTLTGAPNAALTSGSCRKVKTPKYEVILTGAAWRRYVGVMSAQPIHSPKVMPVPAATPDAIRAVLVNAGEPGLLEQFNEALYRAVTDARESSSVEPLNEMLKYWRLVAAEWCDPAKQRAFLAKMDDYAKNGIPADQRVSTEQVLQALEAKHGKGAMGPVWDRLAGRA